MSLDERMIFIVAALILDGAGRTLLVRKRGTTAFMQAGGKPDPGESPRAALARELREELGCGLELASCRPLGRFRVPAANEPGFVVDARLFAARLSGEPVAAGEIEEAVWVDPTARSDRVLAPLTRLHALPLARGLLSTDPHYRASL
jgi:8-oxo-dGTP pyrophosphatase MutT (NUDIX family)